MDSLSEQQSAYVEEMGLFYERYGSQRSLGKLIGVLLIAEQPLSQEDLMRLLSLSRSSTSVALHWATEHLGFVERVSVPGDRKRYYQVRPDIIDWLAVDSFQRFEDALRVFTKAQALAEPGARQRLTLICELFGFFKERLEGALAEWREQSAGR
jgi:DNA-binding transcriptional regulator GbsR (MarR family)